MTFKHHTKVTNDQYNNYIMTFFTIGSIVKCGTVIYFNFADMNFRANPIFDHILIKNIFSSLFLWLGDMQLLSRLNDCHHPSRLVITIGSIVKCGTVIYFNFADMNFRANPIFDHILIKNIFSSLFLWLGDMQLLSRLNDCHHPSRLVITIHYNATS